jgi:hypothetical protein
LVAAADFLHLQQFARFRFTPSAALISIQDAAALAFINPHEIAKPVIRVTIDRKRALAAMKRTIHVHDVVWHFA